MNGRRYSIGDLAEAAGVSRRTVHFYVQRRLIDPPLGRGRGRHYDERHLRQIRRVRALQSEGVSLADIGSPATEEGMLPGENAGSARLDGVSPPRLRPVVRLEVARGVTLEIAADLGPPTPALAADLAAAVARVMRRQAQHVEEEP